MFYLKKICLQTIFRCVYFNSDRVTFSFVSFQKLTGPHDSAFLIYQRKTASNIQGSSFLFVSIYKVNIDNSFDHYEAFLLSDGESFFQETNFSEINSGSFCFVTRYSLEFFWQYGNVRDCVCADAGFIYLSYSESGQFRFFNFINIQVLETSNHEFIKFTVLGFHMWTFYACVFDEITPEVHLSNLGTIGTVNLQHCWIQPGFFNTDGIAGLTSYWINTAQTQPWHNTHQGYEMHLIPI